MKLKLQFMLLMLLSSASAAFAQGDGTTSRFTVYRNFKPAVIHMASGRDITNALTNVFLKNAALLYKQGTETMEARMETIMGVDFDDRSYIKIDGKLAWRVDVVGMNQLFQVDLLDLEAYKTMQKNNVNISSLDLGEQVSYSTVELEGADEIPMPLIHQFYFMFSGKTVRAHDRELMRVLDKEQRRICRTIISLPDFSWTSSESLMKLLKALSAEQQQK